MPAQNSLRPWWTWISRLLGLCRAAVILFGVLVLPSAVSPARGDAAPEGMPPRPTREFRGAWIATVANLDWPSKPGLTTAQQKAELVALFDKAVQLRLNVLILQVRPACDALYSSTIEPWSEFLTGKMGAAPDPYYDPLEFAIHEAHRRGLELHAWFNPFRVRAPNPKTGVAASYISEAHPKWVRSYGSQLWLDPGLKAVRDHSTKVILDVVKRYDIDGVHLDDYFYPYPEKNASGQLVDFPDESSWQHYLAGRGSLSRNDWRRKNIDDFIEELYRRIKTEKRWVKLGISPFGIWRPGFPRQIKGLDSYDHLYADSRKWLAEGWLDYFAPQLYWEVEAADHSYTALLEWWAAQNAKSRHLSPGNNLTKVGNIWASTEIVRQVRLTRKQTGASGNVLWSMASLMRNCGHVADALAKDLYLQPALVPASPWLDSSLPSRPTVNLDQNSDSKRWKISWKYSGHEGVWLWLCQTRSKGKWSVTILPENRAFSLLPARNSPSFPDMVAVTAINRCGGAGPTATLETKRALNMLAKAKE